MQNLPTWLRPPPITDHAESHKARLLYIVTVSLILLELGYGLVAPALAHGYQGWQYLLLIQIVLLTAYLLNKWGQFTVSAWIVTCGLWVVFTFSLFASNQGVYGVGYRAYIVPILIAGLLLGRRTSFGLALASCGVGIFARDLHLGTTASLDPDVVWVGQCLIFLGTALLVGLATHDTRRALALLLTSESQLAQSNQQLTAQIQEREAAQRALKASEARFAKAFYASPAGISISTVDDGRYVDVNDRLAEMLGFFREEMIGRTSVELGIFPDEATRLNELAHPLAHDGRIRNADVVLRNSAGQPLNTRLSVETIELDGQTYVLSMVRDITDERRAQEHRFALALAHERVTMMSEFLSHISHDLKTPLAIIRMSIALLQNLHPPDAFEQGELSKIETQSALLERFIQNILTISRLDYTPRLDLQPIDLRDLLHELERNLRPSAAQKRQTLTFDIDPTSQTKVAASRDDLYRAVANLVENAISYTPEGGHITVTCTHGEVVINDTGIGITPEALPHIFERFYRTEDARHRHKTGSGLGLAIVKRVIEMHHGTVEVESTEGRGTTFRVSLPIR